MLKNKFDSCFRILIYIIWIFLLFVGFYDLFINPYRSIVWFGSFLASVIFYLKFQNIPPITHLLLGIVFVLNVFGEHFFEFYYIYDTSQNFYTSNYDKILHFINPIIVAFFFYSLLKPRIKDKKNLLYSSILATISLSILWEILEFLFDNYLGVLMQGVFLVDSQEGHFFNFGLILNPLADTMIDMALALASMIVFWAIIYLYVDKKELKLR